MFNVTAIPENFSVLLGLEIETTAILASLVFIAVISFTCAVLGLELLGVVVLDIVALTFFTMMGWFPIWIMILIGLAIAVLFARKTVSLMSGEGVS